MAGGILDTLRRALADLPTRIGLGPAIRTARSLPAPLPREPREVIRGAPEIAELAGLPAPGTPPVDEPLLIKREPPLEGAPVSQGLILDRGPELELPEAQEGITPPEDAADELEGAWREARRSLAGRGLRLFAQPLPPELQAEDERAEQEGASSLARLPWMAALGGEEASPFVVRIPPDWGLGPVARVVRTPLMGAVQYALVADAESGHRVPFAFLTAIKTPYPSLRVDEQGEPVEELARALAEVASAGEERGVPPVDILPGQMVLDNVYVTPGMRDTPALMALLGAFRQDHGMPIFAEGPFSPRVARLLHSLEQRGKVRLINSNYEEMFGDEDKETEDLLAGAIKGSAEPLRLGLVAPRGADFMRALFGRAGLRVDDVTDVTWVPTSELVEAPAYGVFGVRVHAPPDANTRTLRPVSQALSYVYSWEPQGIKRVAEDTYFLTFSITKPSVAQRARLGDDLDEHDDEFERMTRAYAVLRDDIRGAPYNEPVEGAR